MTAPRRGMVKATLVRNTRPSGLGGGVIKGPRAPKLGGTGSGGSVGRAITRIPKPSDTSKSPITISRGYDEVPGMNNKVNASGSRVNNTGAGLYGVRGMRLGDPKRGPKRKKS